MKKTWAVPKCTPAFQAWATTSPKTIAKRLPWRARCWRTSTGTQRCRPSQRARSSRRATTRRKPAAKRTGTGTGKRGRPKGSGTRGKEALALVRSRPGITIPEIAEAMKINQNYLYRVLPGLAKDGLVRKDGRGWYPVDAA